MNYETIDITQLNDNFFSKIGKSWMLISASKDGMCNTMTASWGGIGVLWNKNVFFCFIRPQRYTKEFCDASDIITLSFFDESYRDALKFCGANSGRSTDKFEKTGLTPIIGNTGEVDFVQSSLTLVGKKLYAQEMCNDCFIDKSLDTQNYKNFDYHTMYVCEIIEVRKK